jgi:uncharacterized membrane protein
MSVRSMKHRSSVRSLGVLAAMALMGVCGTALAQPTLVLTGGISDDLSSDGRKVVGYFFDFSIPAYVPYVWERGVGFTQVPGTDFADGLWHGSSDFSAFATVKKNVANWGDLNCFNGYCTEFSGPGCPPGALQPPQNPCPIPSLAHHWTASTGWVNPGSVPRLLDPGTGRFFGGTRCDFSINDVNDLSGDGTVMVGGAWSAPLFGFGGGVGSGQCGDFVAWKYDTTTGLVSALPVQPGTTTSRADSVSNDGSVIVGYDVGPINDPNGPYDGRRICVWNNNVQSFIDDLSGTFDAYKVNGPGNVIVGGPGPVFCNANFGLEETRLVKWTRQPDNTWTPADLGRPIDFNDGVQTTAFTAIRVSGISDDGNVIVGSAQYGFGFFGGFSRPFIWSPSINGGVPIDFEAYLAQAFPGTPVLPEGYQVLRINDISADGNAILMVVRDARNTCPGPNASHIADNGAVLYLNGTGIACDAPQIAIQPRDDNSIQYTSFGVSLNIFASGTFPMTYEWQREDPANPGQWLSLTEACAGFEFGAEWGFEGVNKNQLRIGQANCGNNRDGRYRVIVSNSCGSVTSEPATVTFQQGTTVLQQPQNAVRCDGDFAFFQGIAVSNSAGDTIQWEIATPDAPELFAPLSDGPSTLADGRQIEVFGSTGQFMGITPGPLSGESVYRIRAQFFSPCGDATSDVATLTVLDPAGPECRGCDYDFNQDENVDLLDAQQMAQVFVGLLTPEANWLDGDLNRDENADLTDAQILASYVVSGFCGL